VRSKIDQFEVFDRTNHLSTFFEFELFFFTFFFASG
jgi:hypothetical protein